MTRLPVPLWFKLCVYLGAVVGLYWLASWLPV